MTDEFNRNVVISTEAYRFKHLFLFANGILACFTDLIGSAMENPKALRSKIFKFLANII
jgi:hypothetical protein